MNSANDGKYSWNKKGSAPADPADQETSQDCSYSNTEIASQAINTNHPALASESLAPTSECQPGGKSRQMHPKTRVRLLIAKGFEKAPPEMDVTPMPKKKIDH
jgi:hypothetical protein